jgi:hypothetical protein
MANELAEIGIKGHVSISCMVMCDHIFIIIKDVKLYLIKVRKLTEIS